MVSQRGSNPGLPPPVVCSCLLTLVLVLLLLPIVFLSGSGLFPYPLEAYLLSLISRQHPDLPCPRLRVVATLCQRFGAVEVSEVNGCGRSCWC